MVRPYSTCESEGSSVVQEMVAPDEVIADDWTFEIAGWVVSVVAATEKLIM